MAAGMAEGALQCFSATHRKPQVCKFHGLNCFHSPSPLSLTPPGPARGLSFLFFPIFQHTQGELPRIRADGGVDAFGGSLQS